MRLNSDKYGRFCWILQNNHIVHFMIWIRTRFTPGMSSYLFMSLKSYMIGWVNDVEKAVALYSNVLNAVLS